MLESINELHKEIQILNDNQIDTDELVRISDAIEREVEERYIERPVDADGMTISPSDNMVDTNGKQFTVSSIEFLASGQWLVYGNGKLGNAFAKLCHHHKPPTVEDVLEDYRVKYYDLVTDMECKNITNEEYVQGIKELNEMFAAKLQINEEE